MLLYENVFQRQEYWSLFVFEIWPLSRLRELIKNNAQVQKRTPVY
jgi:hypothetical protein